MAVGISAVSNTSFTSPGIDITVTGLTVGRYLRVIRRGGGLPDAVVRGADMVLNGSGTFPVSDYEAQLGNRAFDYIAEEYIGLVLNSSTTVSPVFSIVTQDATNWSSYFFLKSVYQPASSRPVLLSGPITYNVTGRILSNQTVLGRANPVVVTDVNGGRTGSFSFLSVQPPGGAIKFKLTEYRSLLSAGTPLLLQCNSSGNIEELTDIYLMVDGWTYKPMNRPAFIDLSPDMMLEFTVNYVEIDRPTTDSGLVSAGTWDIVRLQYATWTAVQSANATWLAVLDAATP